MPQYQYALVRLPGENYIEGLTTQDSGKPDYSLALKQHEGYREALTRCGVQVLLMEPDLRFPDACFVEDTALVTEKAAIILNLGHRKRRGEQESVGSRLSRFKKLELFYSMGSVDGGDIIRINGHFFIGLSSRTDEEGARDLTQLLARYNYSAEKVPISRVLHLKTGASYLGDGHILTIKEFARHPGFKNYQVHVVDDEEWYAANCLRVNDHVLVPEGFAATRKLVAGLGYKIIEVAMGEFMKMDGSLSCLSLLF